MDIRKVKKLIELLDESGIAEIEITEGEEAVRISRYPTGAAAAPRITSYNVCYTKLLRADGRWRECAILE